MAERLYEIGPIKPPAEAESLLIRVTRGCDWNKCNFCGLYKNMDYSIRSTEDIIEDIKKFSVIYKDKNYKTCFLQDSNAFFIQTDKLLKIIHCIKEYFPTVKHIHSYARADTILLKSQNDMEKLRKEGLDHLFCGMESGSDTILKLINKGIESSEIVESGIRAREAGMTLSELVLFGIGGKEYSDENAELTAQVLNKINPEYIRVHATAFKPNTPMFKCIKNGEITLMTEEEIVREQKK